MEKSEIITKINDYIKIRENKIIEISLIVNNLSFLNLRDKLIGLGKILEENYKKYYYVIKVPAGVANKNSAIVCILWSNDIISIFSYAKEGLINQHTASKAIEKVIDRLCNN